MSRFQIVLAVAVLLALGVSPALAQDGPADNFNFFLTSAGPGDGGNLGGLAGADRHCFTLASSVGASNRRWRAYLSTTGRGGIDARDRIGPGPWYNYNGELVARNVEHLHSDDNNLTKQTALSESGVTINGRGDDPNRHDILTGSHLDGTKITIEAVDQGRGRGRGRGARGGGGGGGGFGRGAPPPEIPLEDTNCENWTVNAENGMARVGHFDREGGGENPTSWNSAHDSRGCSQANLQGTGGDGLFLCFAID